MTRYGWPPIRTCFPIGSRSGKSLRATSSPSTMTGTPERASCDVNARPFAIFRFLMSKYRSEAPVMSTPSTFLAPVSTVA